jgi:hypothetical protein
MIDEQGFAEAIKNKAAACQEETDAFLQLLIEKHAFGGSFLERATALLGISTTLMSRVVLVHASSVALPNEEQVREWTIDLIEQLRAKVIANFEDGPECDCPACTAAKEVIRAKKAEVDAARALAAAN